jgi:hypothetical protein
MRGIHLQYRLETFDPNFSPPVMRLLPATRRNPAARAAEADHAEISGEDNERSGLLLIAHARMKRVKEA